MTVSTKQVTTYNVTLLPQTGASGTGAFDGQIAFNCADNFRLIVRFTKTASANTFTGTTGTAFTDSIEFPYYIDLARNEKPVFVQFNPDVTPPRFGVFTGAEPIGEGE